MTQWMEDIIHGRKKGTDMSGEKVQKAIRYALDLVRFGPPTEFMDRHDRISWLCEAEADLRALIADKERAEQERDELSRRLILEEEKSGELFLSEHGRMLECNDEKKRAERAEARVEELERQNKDLAERYVGNLGQQVVNLGNELDREKARVEKLQVALVAVSDECILRKRRPDPEEVLGTIQKIVTQALKETDDGKD